jgi:Tfp pilus assembly protein PilO
MKPLPLALRPRERRLALMAALLIGCWALVSWLVAPLWEHVRDLRLQVETQTEQLEGLSRLLAQTPSIERAYQVVAPYLDAQDDDQAQGAFLNELESLARGSNIQLSLKPRSVKQEERIQHFEVELDVEGSQGSLLAFLDALLRMPRLMTIERLRISSVPAKEDALRANLLIHKVALR